MPGIKPGSPAGRVVSWAFPVSSLVPSTEIVSASDSQRCWVSRSRENFRAPVSDSGCLHSPREGKQKGEFQGPGESAEGPEWEPCSHHRLPPQHIHTWWFEAGDEKLLFFPESYTSKNNLQTQLRPL